MIKNILKNKKIKNLLIYLCFFIFVTVFVIASIIFISKNKSISLTNSFKTLETVNNGFIDLKISKNILIEDETETVNIVYKTLFDKNYEDNFAVDGSLGIEVESMKIGIYLPIQLIFNKDLNFFTEIDEVYQTIIEIPENNTQMKANLTPIFTTFNPEFETFDFNSFKEDFSKILFKYLKENQKDFNFIKSDEQFYIFTKAIGRFNKNISETDFENIEIYLNEICEEDSINYQIIKYFIDKLKGEYSLYIHIKNNQPYKIELLNNETSIVLNLENINFNKELKIPSIDEDYGLDFNKYLNEHNFNLLSLVGLNEDGTTNLKSLLQKNFKELMSYMYLCIQYSEAGDNNSAQQNIELMTALISSIEETENISKKDLELFNTYIDIYKLLRQYTIIYNQQCFATDISLIEELEEQMFGTIKELSDKMNSLGIDINETFDIEATENTNNKENVESIETKEEKETITNESEVEIIEKEDTSIKEEIITINPEDSNSIITINPENVN